LLGDVTTADFDWGDRIGVAEGLFDVPDEIDAHNAEVGCLFFGENVHKLTVPLRDVVAGTMIEAAQRLRSTKFSRGR
jgi:hypothetical protein